MTSPSAVALMLLVLSLLAVPLSGCLGEAPDGPAGASGDPAPTASAQGALPALTTVVTDPAGDATEHNSDSARYAAPCVVIRDAPSELDPAQCAGHGAGAVVAGDGEPVGGLPAHPARDALAVRMAQTPSALLVELDVGSLEPSLEGAVDREAQEGTMYLVDWTDAVTGCSTGVGYWLRPYADAVSEDAWLHVRSGGSCHEEADNASIQAAPCQMEETGCAWGVPNVVSYGSPATLRWEVPRDWLSGGGQGDVILEPTATVFVLTPFDGAAGFLWTSGTVETYHATGDRYRVDTTGPGTSFDLGTVREPWPISQGALELHPRELHVAEVPQRPDLRFEHLAFELLEARLRFVFTMEVVEEEPRQMDVVSILRLEGQELQLGAYVPASGAWATWSELVFWDGQPDPTIPVELTVEPGTPGRLILEVDRTELAPILPGATVQYLTGYAGVWNETQQAAAGHTLYHVDWAEASWTPLPPLHLLDPTEARAPADQRIGINDPAFDVELPVDMLASSTYPFDLVGAHVQSPAPGEMRFTLSLGDLSNVEVPLGYDAILYAVGVEHERGTDMVGYYRSADQAGGLFFCAPDSTVFADEPGPPPVAWTQIPGRISTSNVGGTQGEASASTSAMLMFAPSDCFGLAEDAEVLNVTALKAGTYVIRRSTPMAPATVETLDTLASEGAFLATFAQPVTEQPSFLSEPFGVDNFWDILGIIVAIVTVLVTLVIFLRRRRTFHRYLDEVRRIQEAYRLDASARATALVALRRRLYDDLESHRISDSHYPIVLDRLRARLTSARLTSLGQRFYDVPARISLRIERLLDDGYLAEEEAAVLEPVIEGSGMPETSARELVERLRTWVEEDRYEVVA